MLLKIDRLVGNVSHNNELVVFIQDAIPMRFGLIYLLRFFFTLPPSQIPQKLTIYYHLKIKLRILIFKVVLKLRILFTFYDIVKVI